MSEINYNTEENSVAVLPESARKPKEICDAKESGHEETSASEPDVYVPPAPPPVIDARPKVLVLGGCGYIGRNFVLHLLRNELVSFVRVVDKMMPVMAYFNRDCEVAFSNTELIQYVQADLTRYYSVCAPIFMRIIL